VIWIRSRSRNWSRVLWVSCREGNYQPAAPPALTFAAPTVDITTRDLPTNYVMGSYVAPSMTTPDIYAMRVASSVLQNRVFVEVRVRRNLSYAPDAFLSSNEANVGGIYVSAVDANQAVRVMLDEITRLAARAARS